MYLFPAEALPNQPALSLLYPLSLLEAPASYLVFLILAHNLCKMGPFAVLHIPPLLKE